jgi:hypothetical protein
MVSDMMDIFIVVLREFKLLKGLRFRFYDVRRLQWSKMWW